jgi:hypothetical protein
VWHNKVMICAQQTVDSREIVERLISPRVSMSQNVHRTARGIDRSRVYSMHWSAFAVGSQLMLAQTRLQLQG